jgi:hypothetical protein
VLALPGGFMEAARNLLRPAVLRPPTDADPA